VSASIGVVKLGLPATSGEPVEEEMDRAAVLAALGPLFEDDPELVEPTLAGEDTELIWEGGRVGTQWVVYAGAHGVRRVALSLWDDDLDGPVEEFRAELPVVLNPLRELVAATGARLFIDGGDLTDASLEEILDALA
jgi:hypothetical protein